MIIDQLRNWPMYPFGQSWKVCFDFLMSLHPSTPEGETSIRGDEIIGRVMKYETKTHDLAKLEAHDRYIDIQSTILGAEALEWFPRESLDPSTEYRQDKDVTYFRYPGAASLRVDVLPGTFVMLFPHDAHMPALRVPTGDGTVTKVVIKLDVRLLTNNVGPSRP